MPLYLKKINNLTFLRKFLWCALLFSPETGAAQEQTKCGQWEMDQAQMLLHPSIAIERQQLEAQTQSYETAFLNRQHLFSDTILYIIPVVVHVMHDYGTENISNSQIYDVVRIMNEYYQKRNADTSQIVPLFQPIIGDAKIEFRLAKLDPFGNCTIGITRHKTHLTNGGDDQLKSIIQWPPEKYLNIWVEKITSNNFSGYAYLPGVQAALDGIVIVHNYTGSIGSAQGNGAPTLLAHEAGHYLNLLHTWGPTNNPNISTNCNLDDQVSDTPNCIGGNCNLNAVGCNPGETANVQNMMDYCTEQMFTQGQVIRMHAALNSNIGNRNNLWSVANLISTGTDTTLIANICPPIADLTDHTFRICQGDSIQFEYISTGGDFSSILWQFTGGNISSSTDTSPTIVYNNAGSFDATLTVTNSAGSSTITRNGLVEVTPLIPITMAPQLQDFETLIFPSAPWTYDNTIGTHWEITSLASTSGNHSIFLQNDSSNFTTEDVFYTESYDLTNISTPAFGFQLAFANRNSSNDRLRVFYSTDCGKTWIMKYTKSGNALQTAGSSAINFIPAVNEWRQEGMNISAVGGISNVKFKFEFTSMGGNNIFIDDIQVASPTIIEDFMDNQPQISVYPNPSGSEMLMHIEIGLTSTFSYTISDIYGNPVFKMPPQKLPEGQHSFNIGNISQPGIYLLQVKINDRPFSKKLIRY